MNTIAVLPVNSWIYFVLVALYLIFLSLAIIIRNNPKRQIVATTGAFLTGFALWQLTRLTIISTVPECMGVPGPVLIETVYPITRLSVLLPGIAGILTVLIARKHIKERKYHGRPTRIP